jgi:hypothetical protein
VIFDQCHHIYASDTLHPSDERTPCHNNPDPTMVLQYSDNYCPDCTLLQGKPYKLHESFQFLNEMPTAEVEKWEQRMDKFWAPKDLGESELPPLKWADNYVAPQNLGDSSLPILNLPLTSENKDSDKKVNDKNK